MGAGKSVAIVEGAVARIQGGKEHHSIPAVFDDVPLTGDGGTGIVHGGEDAPEAIVGEAGGVPGSISDEGAVAGGAVLEKPGDYVQII